jgi:multisubunit Na+/H+ antiporter MnhE subunit
MQGGTNAVLHSISLGVMLFAFWLLLSGHYSPILVGTGAVSAFAVVWFARAWPTGSMALWVMTMAMLLAYLVFYYV